MIYRRIGSSGLQVSLLSFGSWITFGNQIDNQISKDLMITAYDHGVNFFDNAEVYASGRAEIVMGNIIKDLAWDRSSFVLSSKVFFGDGRKLPNQTGLSRKHIFECCNDSLKRLQVDYLDLFYCHRPDKNTSIEETVWVMNHLIQQGKVLYWGTSEWSGVEIMEAHLVSKKLNLIGPIVEQPQYNLLHREKIEKEYLSLYKSMGLGTTIWSPLASGLLTNKYLNGIPDDSRLNREELNWLKDSLIVEKKLQIVNQLNRLAQDLGVELHQIAIAWCAQNIHVSSVILGASNVAQLKSSLGALEALKYLTPEINIQIENIVQNRPIQPMY